VALFVVVFVDLIGFGMVIPVLLLHAQESFGASDLQATMLLASYSIGLVLAGPVLGRLSDAFGRRPVLIISQFGTLVGFLILGFANTLFLLYLGRIIDGISGGNITTAQAYINDITTEKNRARGFGMISAAFGAGFVVGPALTSIIVSVTAANPALAPYSQNAPFFVAAIFSLSSILLTTFLLPESLPKEEREPLGRSRQKQPGQKGLLDVIRLPDVRLILVFTILTFLAFSLLQASFAFFARRNLFFDIPLEGAQRNIGLLLTWIGVVSVTTQFVFVGPLVKRFGERRLVNAATLARVLAFFGIAISRDPFTMALVFIPFAAANAISQPSLQSMLSRFSPPEMRGRVLGAFQSSNSLTLVIGPILTGILLEIEFGFLSAEWEVALPMLVGTLIMTLAFMLSFRLLRMELPSQEEPQMRPVAAPAD
jgi:DHA1 family tetracycline resistance protein-like MFS transporter